MLFVGHYEHTIDAKNRLAIPSDIRQQLESSGECEALFVAPLDGPSLGLYTERDFAKRGEDLDRSERPTGQVLQFERFFYSMARRVEVDKQGRIRIPDTLMNLAQLGREVAVLGVKDHLEVHDREQWNRKMRQFMQEQGGLMMNPRLAMQPEQDEAGGTDAGG